MTKKVWRKPEMKAIEAGAAENASVQQAQDSKGTPNSGS